MKRYVFKIFFNPSDRDKQGSFVRALTMLVSQHLEVTSCRTVNFSNSTALRPARAEFVCWGDNHHARQAFLNLRSRAWGLAVQSLEVRALLVAQWLENQSFLGSESVVEPESSTQAAG